MRLEQFRKPPLGLGIVVSHEAEALGRSIGRDTLADDHLKPARLTVVSIAGLDRAAVDADRQRAVWPQQGVPVALTAVDKERLLVPELAFQALCHLLQVPIHGHMVRLQWQDLFQHLHRHAVRQQRCPLGLEIAQLRGGALGEQGGQGLLLRRVSSAWQAQV